MPEGRNDSWDQLDLNYFIGLDPQVYKHTFFPTKGKVNEVGLTTPAVSLQFGESEIWEQDQSIMGWTCGLGIASALDVARYYYDLLGPEHKILTKESTDIMQQFSPLDVGWSAGYLDYGGGLFIINVHNGKVPSQITNATYIGHEGDTYGFQSTQGFFNAMNLSMSLIVNVDFAYEYPDNLMC